MSNKLSDEVYEYLTKVETDKEETQKLIRKDFRDYVPHFITDKKDYIQCFKYKKGNRTIFIPEPNPIVIYFSNAQSFLQSIEEKRNEIFKELEEKDVGNMMNNFYVFFGFVSNYVTSLFNSLEAFINHQIPNDYKYERITKQKTEIFNKEQIQRELQFEEKIKKVLPQIKTRSFHRHYAHKHDSIMQFKEFRDDIVHTKADQNNTPNYYKNLFTKSLDFDYNKTIHTIRDYINYYEENLIEKCDCGHDY